MSSAASAPRGIVTRLVQLASLFVVFGLLFFVRELFPNDRHSVSVLSAIGFLLLSGTLLSELLEVLRLPHLSGYLLAGVISGPHVLALIDHKAVSQLSPINTLALALIALAGGAELQLQVLRKVARSVFTATLFQSLLVTVAMTVVFALLAPFVPFVQGMPLASLIGVGALWGVLAASRSPAAALAVLAQTRAKGPLATFSLAFIMLSDVVVVVMMAVVLAVTQPLIVPGAELSLVHFKHLGHELLGSVSLGTTLGLLLAAYLRLVGRYFLLVLIALGFGMTDALRYLHLDALLTFLTAGFVVQNLSRQGDKLLHEIENTGKVVFVVFFATAGAHLDLPLLKAMWPIAVGLAFARVVFTYIAARLSSRSAKDGPVVTRWGWSGLVSQAGLTLGLSVTIEHAFPSLAGGFRSLVIATVAVNEIIGPILFKLALDRAGETQAEELGRNSLHPEQEHA